MVWEKKRKKYCFAALKNFIYLFIFKMGGCIASKSKASKTMPEIKDKNSDDSQRIMAPRAPTISVTAENEHQALPHSLRKFSLFVVGEEASALEDSALPPSAAGNFQSNLLRQSLQTNPRTSIA
ncbi:unnamed protein product [Blepharisma stoltei]|uniref:Uncharacterized protein n=1 Tax=Blepharisma stoltei TaxID=1481888 RepID=A0AAU9JSU4_9CILI|nr:unnamed protein product [Blepharisma stoltei]